MRETAESRQSLWLLAAGPLVWAAHFMLIYVAASLWCAKVAGAGGSLESVRIGIVIFTALALGAIGLIGYAGYRRHSYGEGEPPHDDDTPEDRHRFLGYATLLLAALSAVAVIYAGLVAAFVERC